MAILIKPFYGVPQGALYPQWFQVGSECPPELVAAASAVQALELELEEDPDPSKEKTSLPPPAGTKKR